MSDGGEAMNNVGDESVVVSKAKRTALVRKLNALRLQAHGPVVLDLLAKADAAMGEADDEIDAWKNATGLTAGGCPEGVTPAMLERFVAKAWRLEQAAKAYASDPEDHVRLRELNEALADMPREE